MKSNKTSKTKMIRTVTTKQFKDRKRIDNLNKMGTIIIIKKTK